MVNRDPNLVRFARELANNPGLVNTLLEAHYPEKDGSCAGCRLWDRPSNQWPCVITAVCQAALRVIEDRVSSVTAAG